MDTHKVAYGKWSDLGIYHQEIMGLGYSEALKFSQCQDVTVGSCDIIGGTEDCIDVVRGSSYQFENLNLYPKGKFGITIKGGAVGISITGCTFHSHGSECDIDLGNWTNYDIVKRPKVRNILIQNCQSTTGYPIKVRVLHSDIPTIVDSNVELKVIHPFFVWCFFFARRLGIGGNVTVDPEELKLQEWEKS